MSEAAKGVAAMVGVCLIWGLSPIFYAQVKHVPPLEVLAHRTIWSLAFFGAWMVLRKRMDEVARIAARPRTLAVCGAAAIVISINWFFFIYATQVDRVTESSLGYYIFPLVAVLLGRFVLREKLGRRQWIAVGMAAAAVTVLAVGLGAPPWISLGLAFSFGLYGLLKRQVAAGPVLSVTVEVALLAPLAVGYLALAGSGEMGEIRTSLFLILSGPLTAIPLVLFSYAARRVRMATVGLIQYLNPTVQFAVAMSFFGEALTVWHAVAFPAIWAALALYSIESLREERLVRRAAALAAAPGTGAT
ncbi:EamA family transporter RarD [Roseitranquillus sediminis]|uniref:EamA family transporter RarD n=1 Tax=Roseitranquillus sediminis TaxID=2809051 RepID=UPI001D0C347B|nr:EamA family transporter RarD [Roseitranquillus sediminis]MBM9594329.1 EamA family transporter RarD [Roseitranquillus sediminis]